MEKGRRGREEGDGRRREGNGRREGEEGRERVKGRGPATLPCHGQN